MIYESMILGAIAFCGYLLLKTFMFKGWVLLPLGFLTGISAYLSIAHLQILVGLDTSPLVTFSILLLVTVTIHLRLRTKETRYSYKSIAACGLLILAFTALFWGANLTKYHFDPFRYLITGSLIAQNQVDAISSNLATKRLSAVSMIHAPANTYGELYLRAITPLISLSLLACFYWLVARFSKYKNVVIPGLIGLLLLATNRSFVWHSFYINGHLLFAAFFLLIVGTGALLAQKNKPANSTGLIFVQWLAISGLMYTRQEAALFGVLAILPTILSPNIPRIFRQATLGVTGIAILVKELTISRALLSLTGSLDIINKELVLLGVIIVAATVLLFVDIFVKYRHFLLNFTELLLWLAVLALTVKSPNIMHKSIVATWANIFGGNGGWGYSIIILGVIVILAILLSRKPLRHLRFPVTTFVPIALLLPLLREGAYRVGITDSLNRMWIQIIPAAVLYVVVVIVTNSQSTEKISVIKRVFRAKRHTI